MGESDLSGADFAALLEVVETRFHAWQLNVSSPEQHHLIGELKRKGLSMAGRAAYALQIYEDSLKREVRQRIGYYSEMAHQSGKVEMLDAQRLKEYRERVMASVQNTCQRLKDDIEHEARLVGGISPALLEPLLNQPHFLRDRILDIVNAELGPLEAEGRLAPKSNPTPRIETDHGERTTAQPKTDDHTNVLGANITRLRMECGWSYDDLEASSDVGKKLTLGHVNKGKGANPSTLKRYADAFTKRLGRPVTVAELSQSQG